MKFLSFLLLILKTLCVILPIFISVAFLTLFERKVMASMQRRRGPNIVGFLGLLQPFADALKLLAKETIIPHAANMWIFIFSPILSLTLALAAWAVIPFQSGLVLVDLNVSVLYIFVISSLAVYAIIMSGWASNSKYAFLGSLRSIAQMISYEVSMSLIVMSVLVCSGSFNFSTIVLMQEDIFFCIPLFPLFIMFFISALAETNRPPFDLPEAENELVAGYFVEYGGAGFALFFIAETANIILMSFLTTIYFFGGWYPLIGFFSPSVFWLATKVLFFCFLFVWVRASLPRYRYDQLMFLGWKVFLPSAVALLFFIISVLFFFGGLPANVVMFL